MFRLTLSINVVLFSLLCSPVLLGMKRKHDAERDGQLVTSEMIHNKLDQLYKQAMPDLKIIEIVSLRSNKNIAQLSAPEQLRFLSEYNGKRRKVVDILQQKRRLYLLSLPAEEALQRIETEEEQIPVQLNQNQINAQEKLRLAYNIDANSSSWLNRMRELNAVAQFNLKTIQEPSNNTTWCINTPPNFAYELLSQMENSNLDPSAFEVKCLPDDRLYCRASVLGACPIIEYVKTGDKYRLHLKKGKPASIWYNPSLIGKSNIILKQLVAHELNHLLRRDTEFAEGTARAVSHCAKVSGDEICKHPAYVGIRLAQEIYADAALSLEDHTKINDVIKYADNLYPESYNVLAMLKTNDEVRAEIATRK